MKMKQLLIGLVLCMGISAQAQSSNVFVTLAGNVKTFLTDNTNLFNQGIVQVEVGPVFNVANYHYGADMDVQFPIAQQASVGFNVLYYNGVAYNGTVNTTLGTTWTVPFINQPVYTYAKVGVGTDLQNASHLINEEWAGARWQYQFGGSFTNLSFTLNGAVGHLSGESGAVLEVLPGLQYKF
jgi:hypothetical protein